MIEQAWNYKSTVVKDINNSEGCSNGVVEYWRIKDFDMGGAGLSQLPYEEYINIDVDAEFGCLTLKN